MLRRLTAVALFSCACVAWPATSRGGPFNLTVSIANPAAFTPNQLQIVEQAALDAEALWESVVVGYRPGISLMGVSATINGTQTGFAEASITGFVTQGGFTLSTGGSLSINVNIVEEFASFRDTGRNIIDELLAHEIGHLFGIGSLWTQNGLYQHGTGRYTGAYGLAAYREEFDPSATFVPVELAGAAGTANKHWDQIMRSSVQEGNPSDPYSLSPLLGIVDAHGRDLALELMTGAMDADYSEPFLSNTTVQSLRDLGFEVRAIPEPASIVLAAMAMYCAAQISTRRPQRGE